MVTERVEGEKRSARHNSAMCSSAAHAREAGGGMAARCTGCWCTRTVERELPAPVAERHGGSSITAAAAVCQRAGGYGAGLGTLAAAAAVLVMARDELLCHGARSSSGTKVFGWHSLGLRLAPAEARPKSYETWMHIHRDAPTCHEFLFSLRGARPKLTANLSA